MSFLTEHFLFLKVLILFLLTYCSKPTLYQSVYFNPWITNVILCPTKHIVPQHTKANWHYIKRYTFGPRYTNFRTSCLTKHFLFPNILKLNWHYIKLYTFCPWYTNFTSCPTEHFMFRDILKLFYSIYLCRAEPCILPIYYKSHTWYSIRLWTLSAVKSSVDCSNWSYRLSHAKTLSAKRTFYTQWHIRIWSWLEDGGNPNPK